MKLKASNCKVPCAKQITKVATVSESSTHLFPNETLMEMAKRANKTNAPASGHYARLRAIMKVLKLL